MCFFFLSSSLYHLIHIHLTLLHSFSLLPEVEHIKKILNVSSRPLTCEILSIFRVFFFLSLWNSDITILLCHFRQSYSLFSALLAQIKYDNLPTLSLGV